MPEKQRSSNLEMLRIFAMYLIVLHHACVHGALNSNFELLTQNCTVIANVLSMGGKLGVILFVMITGYFMITSRFKFKSFLKVLLPTFFYGIAIIVLFYLFDSADITSEQAIKSLLLNSSGGLPWFVVAYLGMYLFIPFINRLANGLTRNQYRKLLLIGAVCFSVIPTAFNLSFISSSFAWFVYLYFLAGYLRLYDVSFSKGRLVAIIAIPLIAVVALTVLLTITPSATEALNIGARYFAGNYSLFLLIAAIGIFIAFAKWDLGYSRFVNSVASTTFGIYLIHDNSIVRSWLWSHLIPPLLSLRACLLVPALIGLALGVFAVCALIDYVRQLVVRVIPCDGLCKRLKPVYARIDAWFNE